MFHLRQGQHGTGLGVRPAVSDVDPGIAGQVLEQQTPQRPERPLASGLIQRPQHPGRQDVAAQRLLRRDGRVAFIGTPVVRGDRLRGEERQPGDPVPGELGDDAGGHSRVRPFHLRAPAIPHRQRHHHVAQQHRDVDRGVRHQREPERDRRMREHIEGKGQVRRYRVAEHAVTDLHRQRRGVQRDDLPGPVHRHVHLRGLDAVGRPVIAGTGAARPDVPGAQPDRHTLGAQVGRRTHKLRGTHAIGHSLAPGQIAAAHDTTLQLTADAASGAGPSPWRTSSRKCRAGDRAGLLRAEHARGTPIIYMFAR